MGKRILVADDSQTIQRAFEFALHGEGMTLLPARSYDQALQLAGTQAPDVVVADVTLGDRTGYDLCTAIKSSGARVPVLILASKQTPFDEARGRAAGADGHLIKPFDSQKLLEALNTVRLTEPVHVRTTDAVPVVTTQDDTSRRTDEFVAEDSYGEFTIERTATDAAPPPALAATTPPAAAAPPARSTGTMPAVAAQPSPLRPTAPTPVVASRPTAPVTPPAPPRPSLIPGVKPGTVRPPVPPTAALRPPPAPGRPPASAPMTPAPLGAAPSVPPAVVPPVPAVASPVAVSRARAPVAAPASEGATPVASQAAAQTPADGSPLPGPDPVPLKSRVGSAVDGKLAALAERGPEYAAIAKLSREIIEQVVWEVVPELAEVIIRENVERLARK